MALGSNGLGAQHSPLYIRQTEGGLVSKTAPGADTTVELVRIDHLASYAGNPRTHSPKQVRQIAKSIHCFGFCSPILIGDDNEIIAGHGRVEAAKLLGLTNVPALRLSHLSTIEKRAYVIADNRLAEIAAWDREALAIELQGLLDLNFDLETTGFDVADLEIVQKITEKPRRKKKGRKGDHNELSSALSVSRAGDVWLLGAHQLYCGDTDDHGSYASVDTALQGWQSTAGKAAVLVDTGQTFAEVKKERARSGPASRATTRQAS
jgi:hypothetical protein